MVLTVKLLHRKETIVLTAIEIIDQLGIRHLSTREIAKRENISEGTIFKHFKSKNDIILAVLDHFCKYDNDLLETIKIKKLKPEAALRFVIDAYATYYENYPAITVIPQIYSILSYEPELSQKVRQIMALRSNLIREIIEQAKEQGVIKAVASSQVITDIIIGSISQTCLNWRMSGYCFSLKERILQAMEVIFSLFQENQDNGV